MINTVNLIGRLTKDIEVKATSNNKKYSNFTLAVQRDVKKSDGTYDSDFIGCQGWGKTVDILDKYTQKGSLIAVLGRIQTRNYDGQDGKKVYVTEVVVNSIQLLDKIQSQSKETVDYSVETSSEVVINSDDLPF